MSKGQKQPEGHAWRGRVWPAGTRITEASSGRPERAEHFAGPRGMGDIPAQFRAPSKPPGSPDAPQVRESFSAYRARLDGRPVPEAYALPSGMNETARWGGAGWTWAATGRG